MQTIMQAIENQVLTMPDHDSPRAREILHKIKNIAQVMGIIAWNKKQKSGDN